MRRLFVPTLLFANLTACAPAQPMELRTLPSGGQIQVSGSSMTGWPDRLSIFLVYISVAADGQPLIEEIGEVWQTERPKAEAQGVELVFIQAEPRYPTVEVTVDSWLPRVGTVPRERGCMAFSRRQGRWEKGELGCCGSGLCDLRGGYPQPSLFPTIGPTRPEFLLVYPLSAIGSWLAAASGAALLRRISEPDRRWIYGGVLFILVGALVAIVPLLLIVGAFRLTPSTAEVPGLIAIDTAVWSALLLLPLLYAVRVTHLTLRFPTPKVAGKAAA